jgi:hypothetical protein
MANNFLILGTLAAFGWVVVDGAPPSTEPSARPSASRVATADFSRTANAAAGPLLGARQAAVPVVKNFRPPPEAPPFVASTVNTQQPAQDDLDMKAAKAAAIEADGYRRVTVLSKADNGTWRAKGFRGWTDVLPAVDASARVSMD